MSPPLNIFSYVDHPAERPHADWAFAASQIAFDPISIGTLPFNLSACLP